MEIKEHKEIWLQYYDEDGEPNSYEEVYWCEDNIMNGDVKYIHHKEVEQLQQRISDLERKDNERTKSFAIQRKTVKTYRSKWEESYKENKRMRGYYNFYNEVIKLVAKYEQNYRISAGEILAKIHDVGKELQKALGGSDD